MSCRTKMPARCQAPDWRPLLCLRRPQYAASPHRQSMVGDDLSARSLRLISLAHPACATHDELQEKGPATGARRPCRPRLLFRSRVATAGVCRDWAAVHAHDRRIWEAVSLGSKNVDRTAADPGGDEKRVLSARRWLAARCRAGGARQLLLFTDEHSLLQVPACSPAQSLQSVQGALTGWPTGAAALQLCGRMPMQPSSGCSPRK